MFTYVRWVGFLPPLIKRCLVICIAACVESKTVHVKCMLGWWTVWPNWAHFAAFCCFWVILATFGCFWLLLAAFGCVWLLLAAFGCFWLLLAAFGCFGLLLAAFYLGFLFHFHPNKKFQKKVCAKKAAWCSCWGLNIWALMFRLQIWLHFQYWAIFSIFWSLWWWSRSKVTSVIIFTRLASCIKFAILAAVLQSWLH